MNNVYGKVPQVTSEQCAETLEEIGFGNKARGVGGDRAADASMVMTSYSGGWKMKMQLGAALLVQADLLMLDEPTGHLDVRSAAGFEFANSLKPALLFVRQSAP